MKSPFTETHLAWLGSRLAGTFERLASVRLTMAAVLILWGVAITARAQSALDGFDPNANGLVRAVVVQPDGKILLGGDFTTLSPSGAAAVPRNRIARLNPDGTLDSSFNPNANSAVYAIAVQSDGRILAGGVFTTLAPNGGATVTRNRIARLNMDGSLDTGFDPNANNAVLSFAVQVDGRILAGGDFTNIGGLPRTRMARLDSTTGAADLQYEPSASSSVWSIVVQPDGKALVGGSFTEIGGQARFYIARLKPDATLDTAFHPTPNADGSVRSIAVQADGRVVVGGQFTTIGGQPRNRIARLDATTGLADPFNPNASSDVRTIGVVGSAHL
ncbi:MAG: delta-60 repeat domain-containing protein, partial [Verrucomicrobiota bacterium]